MLLSWSRTRFMKILKDQPCEQCGTTRYRETPEGGMVCKYGHLLVGWRQEEADDYVWMGRSQKKAPVLKEAKHGIEGESTLPSCS